MKKVTMFMGKHARTWRQFPDIKDSRLQAKSGYIKDVDSDLFYFKQYGANLQENWLHKERPKKNG